jgi:L-lactate dehydrogenase (FMN-dependent) and related alpha-hydroxy acid dehydrogenases
MTDRREFLRYLTGSPLLAAVGLNPHFLRDLASDSPRRAAAALSLAQQQLQAASLIHSPAEALDVFDFEPVAQKNIPVAHWAYLATGTDDDGTIRANREGFDRLALRPRRLVDVHKIDASVSLFGTHYPTPIVINPVGSQKAFHPLGEIASRVRPRRRIICKSCRRWRRHPSRMPSPLAARRSGFSSTISPTGRERSRWWSAPSGREAPRWSTLST